MRTKRPLGVVFTRISYSVVKTAVRFAGVSHETVWVRLPPSDHEPNTYRVEPFNCGEGASIVRFVPGSQEKEWGATAGVPFTSTRSPAGDVSNRIRLAAGTGPAPEPRTESAAVEAHRIARTIGIARRSARRIRVTTSLAIGVAPSNALWSG